MIVRQTTLEEDKRVNELFAIAFELPADDGPATEDDPKVHHWAAYEEKTREMMSTFTISDFQIRFDGTSCKMGGVGGVATLPQYRRKGGIRGCFNKALPEMYRTGYDFSYLYPFSTGYYRKFGFECCVQKLMVSVNLGLLKPEQVAGECYLAEKHHSMKQEIQSIDRVWEEKYNMMVIHEEEDYDWTEKSDPAGKQEFTYVYLAPDQTPKGYMTFRKADQPDGRNLVCSRFVFLDREGFEGLMCLLKSLSSDHMFAKFSLPAMRSMEYLLPEWAMGAAQWSVQNAGMVRIINVENVLKKAAYLGSGTIAIEVKDGQIPENNGVFQVKFIDGKAETVCRTEMPGDIALEISTLSALISGVAHFGDAAQWMNGIEIQNPDGCFDQVFYPKALMIADYF